jgi:hypothetical protein
MRRNMGIFGLMVAVVFAGSWAYAQGEPQPAQPAAQEKPPSVARISMIRGDVSIQRGDSGDWVASSVNTPVMAGDKISTGKSALAELQLDYANILRLSEQSAANVTGLDSTHIQVQLAQGLGFYSVFKGAEGGAEIDTPNVAVHPGAESEIRVQVNSPTETVVVARKGGADITTSQGSAQVSKGQMITIRGASADALYQIADTPSKDSWDRLNEDRDNKIQSAQSWAHVDTYYAGAADLDGYGRWVYVPDYDWVWTPTVPPDWAPYSAGNWVWEPYYGWTWVSYEPWGWAPYHYGRWFSWNNSWAWWPGPISPWYRPIWAPAYVSFFGFGAGRFGFSFGFGFGFGSIGWLPIGPCDPFFPWYGGFGFRFGFAGFDRFHGRDFFRGYPGAFGPLAGRYNERSSNFWMAEHDPHILGGVTSVRAEDFGQGAGRQVRGLTLHDFQTSHVVTGGVPAVPTRASLAASNRAVNPATIRNEQGMRFFGSSQSQAAPRTSFNEQASRVQNALHGYAPPSVQREGPGAASTARPSTGSSGASIRPPTRNETQPGNTAATAPTRGGQAGEPEGWNRFGNASGTGTQAGRGATAQPNQGVAGAARNAPSANNTPSYRPRVYQPPASSGNQSARPGQNPQSGASSGGWQHFTPRPAQPQTGRGSETYSPPRYQGSPSYSRAPAPGYNSRPGYSTRPPLNMSRPIISGPPRSAPSRSSSGRVGGAPRTGGGGRSSAPSGRRR